MDPSSAWNTPGGTQKRQSSKRRTLVETLQEELEAEQARFKKREAEAAAAVEAMADDVLHRILRTLNENRMRPIDLFRKIDTRGDLSCSADEFCEGLLWMGFEPTDREFEVLMCRLDKTGDEGVSLKQFHTTIKAVDRKLVDPQQRAAKATRRARTALATLRGPKLMCPAACGSCGGTKTLHKLLGYTPTTSPLMEPMTAVDGFMLKIMAQMNARKYRSIDFFRTMDSDSSGTVSGQEFRVGLKKMGLTPSKEEFDLIMDHLDKDGSGEVSGFEFDRAAKLIVRKAKLEGRFDEIDTWATSTGSGARSDDFLPRPFDWRQRSIRATTSGSWTERSSRSYAQWSSASAGPRGMIGSMPIGSGSVYDASVSRERYFDSACSGAHPTSTKMPALPLHKTVYKKAYFDGRFGKEPSIVKHPKMLRSNDMDRCLTATRGKFTSNPGGGVRTFHNTPMMQSTVDQAIFNRDMDYSGDSKLDESFMAMYKDCAGMSSWFTSED